MFSYGDKVTLGAFNFTNKAGHIVDVHLSFPLKEDFELPEDIIYASIFETEQGISTYGYVSFNIYVGGITTIEEIASSGKGWVIKPGDIKNVDDKLCYYFDETDRYIVFAKINKGDIVVKDTSELKKTIINISNNFKVLKDTIENIKHANEFPDNTLDDEDIEISKKRREMCVKQREESFLKTIIEHNNQIESVSMNDEYLNWLITFTQKHGSFCTDSWSYNKNDLTDEELLNVNRLQYFYEAIEEYASERHLDATIDPEGHHYTITYNGENLNIGFMAGQGSFVYCENADYSEKAFDFNDIIKYHNNNKTKTLKKTI